MTFVLPLPVTPRRTCWLRPDRTPSTSCSIACGWSPAGLKGASTRKREGTVLIILGRTDVREQKPYGRVRIIASSVEPALRTWPPAGIRTSACGPASDIKREDD